MTPDGVRGHIINAGYLYFTIELPAAHIYAFLYFVTHLQCFYD